MASKKKDGRSNAIPTVKQEKLAKIYIEEMTKDGKTKTKGEMLKSAGYEDRTASAQTERAFNAVGFKNALARSGWSMDDMQRVYKEAGEANVVSVHRGVVTESDVPDHKIRMSAMSGIGDMLGMKKLNIVQTSVNVTLSGGDMADFLG